jgi:hypothetical protein
LTARMPSRVFWDLTSPLVAICCLLAPAQPADLDEPELPAVSWWGGETESITAALESAGNWARTAPLDQGSEKSRAWLVTGGQWAVGISLGKNPESPSERQDRQGNLEMRAIQMASFALGTTAKQGAGLKEACLAVSGARVLFGAQPVQIVGGDNARVSAYAEDGRIFSIAVWAKSGAMKVGLKGMETAGWDRLVATGILSECDHNSQNRQALALHALTIDGSIQTLALAADSCLAWKDKVLAVAIHAAYKTVPVSLDNKTATRFGLVSVLADSPDSVGARLGKEDSLASKAALLASVVQGQGNGDMPLVVYQGHAPAIFEASHPNLSNARSLRDCLFHMTDVNGSVKFPTLALSAEGELVTAPQGSSWSQPGVHVESGATWILLSQAPDLDPRLRPRGERVILPALSAGAPHAKTLSAAGLQLAVRMGAWGKIANGAVASWARSEAFAREVLWVVPGVKSGWEVDFTPRVADSLAGTPRARPFVVSFDVENADSLVLLKQHMLALSGDTSAFKSTDLSVTLEVEPGAVETGEEQGSILAGKKKWGRIPLEVRLTLAVKSSQGLSTVITRTGATKRFFGGFSPEDGIPETVSALVRGMVSELPSAIRLTLDAPRPVDVLLENSDALMGLTSAARIFGPLSQDDEDSNRIHLFWPGGLQGLMHTKEQLAQSVVVPWLENCSPEAPED